MNYLSTSIAALLATLAIHTTAIAQQQEQQQQQAEHRLGDHPAVIVKRNSSQRPINYASTFYPHPAWLWLASEPRSEAMDSPILASNDRARHDVSARPVSPSTVAASTK